MRLCNNYLCGTLNDNMVICLSSNSFADQAGAVDDAKHRKQERNTQQRKRQAEQREEINRKQREYRTEQREEINRKQREYRARKKAESNHTIPTTIVTPTVPSTSLTGADPVARYDACII